MRHSIASAVLLSALAPLAQGQNFPSGPIRIIAAVAPGVPSDVLSRGLVDPLSKQFGVPVFVENRIGADSIIGTLACAKSAADGQTLCSTGNSAISLNAAMRAKLPYDPLKDLAGVVLTGFFDSCLAINANVPANNVKELIAFAKAKPGSVNWAHFGVNSTGYLYEEYLNKSQAAGFYQVPYKTQPQVLQALITGEAQAAVYAWPNLLPHLNAGKVKCLAMTSFQRLPNFPSVPTFAEEGVKLPLRPWFSYHYQAATPKPVINRMNAEIRKAMQTPEYKGLMAKLGMQAADGTPDEFDSFVRDQIRDTVELIKYLGIKPLED
jgi:tripartite-type tricarboxylate transporter receptor subunit TctC